MFQKTLGMNDFYLGTKEWAFPMGHISFVGKLDGDTLKAGAPALAPGFTLELMARHSLDFWLTSEDLPHPDNRVTGELYNGPVGAVYFIKHKTALDDTKTNLEDDYIVSIMVAPECRKMGYGKNILETALRQIDRPCYAEIIDANYPSRRIFEQCGFVKIEQNAISSRSKWVPNGR